MTPKSSTSQSLSKPVIAEVQRRPLKGHLASILGLEQGLDWQTAARGPRPPGTFSELPGVQPQLIHLRTAWAAFTYRYVA